jgi:hypothetical protein
MVSKFWRKAMAEYGSLMLGEGKIRGIIDRLAEGVAEAFN